MDEKTGLKEACISGEITAAAGQNSAAAEAERLTWQQIMQDAEYRACFDSAVQAIVRRRLKNRGDAEQQLRELSIKAAEKSRRDMHRVCCHLDALMAQETELKRELPEFELLAALQEPGFLRLTAPHTGLSLADAWYALHREEIGRRAARESLEKLSRSIISGAARPEEMLGGRAGERCGNDPRGMSRAQREQLKKRIYAAGVMGEKVYP